MISLPRASCLLFLWIPLWVALIPTWKGGLYYEFGWLVPPSALFFARNRWLEARESVPARDGSRSGLPEKFALPFWSIGVVVVAVLTICRVFEMVDASWRRVLVPHALLVATITFAGLAWLHGRRVALWFLPVILFALTAVPLPSFAEQGVIRTFTGAIIGSSAEILRLIGYPITVRGDVLASFAGTVAVTEGCSGLRSFQSLLMASLFFGELYRLKWRWRILLIGVGTVFGLLTNMARAVSLSLISIQHGEKAFDHWHDPIGQIAFLLAIGGLFLLARRIEALAGATERPLKPTDSSPIAGSEDSILSAKRRAGMAMCVAACLGVELLSHAWFWAHAEPDAGSALPLHFSLPQSGVQRLDLKENVASDALHYDAGDWIAVTHPENGHRVELFRFEYRRSNAHFFGDVLGHSPEDCMGSRGFGVAERFPDRMGVLGSERVAFEALSFQPDPQAAPLFVFKTRWIANLGSLTTYAMKEYRVGLVLRGQRRPPGPAVVVLASVSGCETETEAWAFFVEAVFSGKVESRR